MKIVAPCALTIAGSDSGGNAGVQADLRAFHAYGLHGCTVFAALTAQNPFGVSAIHPVPIDFVEAELAAVLGVYDIRALKTGMLATPALVSAVAAKLKAYPKIAKVIDPVMIATSGARLIEDKAVQALEAELLPQAAIMTPNLMEARFLAKRETDDAEELARALYGKYGVPVLVKGGHGQGGTSVDVLFDGRKVLSCAAPRIENPVSTHGTGCSLAAALAAELALGADLAAAVKGAKEYVYNAIKDSYWVGKNCGVLGFHRMR